MISAAGLRRKRITVERHNGNAVSGEPTYRHDPDWDPILVDLPAAYQDVTGGEVLRGRQMEAHTNGLFKVPSTPRTRAITAKMRVKLDGRTLYVVNALDLGGDDRELAIQVTETAP